MSALRQRLLHGLGANGFGQLVNVLIQIVSVPLFVHYWGVTLYGEWLILSIIPAYLAMSDMGFSSVTGNQMTMEVAAGDNSAALRTYQSAWVFLCLACLLVLGLGLGAAWLPVGKWLNLATFTNLQLQLVIALLSLAVIVNLQTGLLAAGFRCDGHYALGTWITNLVRLVEFGATCLGLYLGAAPAAVAGIMLMMRCLGYLITIQVLNSKSPWIKQGWHHASLAVVKAMARPAIAFMAFPLGNALKNQGLLTIVGVTIGPAMVVAFSAMRTLVNATQQAMGLINNAVWPELSAAYGSGNLLLACKLHRIACKASFWMAVSAVVVLFFAGAWILQIWTLGKVSFDRTFFTLMLITMLINSFWFTSSVVQAATNTHVTMAILYLIATAAASGVAYILTSSFGIAGPALGLLVLEITMALYVLPASLSRVKDRGLPFFRYVLNPMTGLKTT